MKLFSLTGLEDTHGSGDWYGVKVLEANFRNHVFVRFQRNFKNVALLGLSEKEEHGFGLVCGAADENHSSLGVVQVVATTRNRRSDVRLIAKVFVSDVIFGANQNARWSVVAACGQQFRGGKKRSEVDRRRDMGGNTR